jgi:hypothetical protein
MGALSTFLAAPPTGELSAKPTEGVNLLAHPNILYKRLNRLVGEIK